MMTDRRSFLVGGTALAAVGKASAAERDLRVRAVYDYETNLAKGGK